MKAGQKIRSLLHQPKPIVSAGDNPFKAPDRATLKVCEIYTSIDASVSWLQVSRSHCAEMPCHAVADTGRCHLGQDWTEHRGATEYKSRL